MLKSITDKSKGIGGGWSIFVARVKTCFNELFNIANLSQNFQPHRGSVGSPFEYRLLAISYNSVRFFLSFKNCESC